jgi:predicted aspartyl protease
MTISTSKKTRPYIEAQFSNTDETLSVTCHALIDTGADVSCISDEIAKSLELQSGVYSYIVVQTAIGQTQVARCPVNIIVGGKLFRNQSVIILPNLSTPLIGWDILGEQSILSSISSRLFNEVIHILGSLDSLKRQTVLILGQDSTEIHRLRAIELRLKALGYTGIIVKDIADIEIQSTEEKVNMLASLCRFVICENSVASGHIDELKICASNRFVTAILQQEGLGATWMQADYALDFPFIKTFKYSNIEEIEPFVDAAVAWAEAKIEERRTFFNDLYHWR